MASTAKNLKKFSGAKSSSFLDPEIAIKAYTEMYRARMLDLKAITLYKQNKCHFQIGASGHECIQVATAMNLTPGVDWLYPYYRDLALCSYMGMSDYEFFLMCMNKKDDPNSHGRMMPMHYGHKRLNMPQQSSPTGTQFLQAVGCAKAGQYKNEDYIVYVSAGEGTCSQGDFHEALSWASRDKLPILFMIQNNDFAISVHVSEQLGADSVYDLTAGYKNLSRYKVDGSDFLACLSTSKEAINYIKKGNGPVLIEAHVPRLLAHSISDDHNKYRSKEEIEELKTRCPLVKLKKALLAMDIASEEEITAIETQVKQKVDEASELAEKAPDCDPNEVETCVYVDNTPWLAIEEKPANGQEVYLVDALNHALDEELDRNPDMLIFGQDVADGKGGVFTVTAGLSKKYGNKRVFNAPLAESSIAGVAIGMATKGLKPVAEIQFGDYVWTAMMQIRNELAMMHYRSGGDFSCPAVIRIPVGGYIAGGFYHSQNIEATFSHFPGLYIVYPSNATDAKGLLKASIRGKDPVLFLEHKGLYRQVYAKGPEGDAEHLVPLGKAKIVRAGSDATIVTWGAIVQKSILAAKTLEEEQNYSVEVIDIRTIVPLDTETIFKSVEKTGRVLIAHEDVLFMGFGAEIASLIAENCFQYLDAPIKRLGMKNVAGVAHSPILESATLPQNKDVLIALKQLLEF